jgi:hypothetical protein
MGARTVSQIVNLTFIVFASFPQVFEQCQKWFCIDGPQNKRLPFPLPFAALK